MKKQILLVQKQTVQKLFVFAFGLLPFTANAQCPDDNHPHMIDLGLPSGTKWACCNVGAATPEECGEFYAWGETEPKDSYTEENYAFYYKNRQGVFYEKLGNISGTKYDVAHVKWGGDWVMPTPEQMGEIITECETGCPKSNHSLFKVYGPNGNYIIIPMGGFKKNYIREDKGDVCWIWIGSYIESYKFGAWGFFGHCFSKGGAGKDRYLGYNVRPVVNSK